MGLVIAEVQCVPNLRRFPRLCHHVPDPPLQTDLATFNLT